jgi:hypothetical protein
MAANQVPDVVPIVLPAEVPGVNEATAVRDQDEANVNVPDIVKAPQAHHPAQPGEVCICLITTFCSLWFNFPSVGAERYMLFYLTRLMSIYYRERSILSSKIVVGCGLSRGMLFIV